jgi:hypothetical protein
MRILLAGLAAVLPFAVQAQSDQRSNTINLEPGAHVNIQVEDGLITVVGSEPAAAGEKSADRTVPGQISLSFSGGAQSMLVVRNGYDRALVYRARMHVGSRSAATSVCVVLPKLMSFEQWPHPIDKLELSNFKLVESKDGASIRCE